MIYQASLLQASDKEEILEFESRRLRELIPNELERSMASWEQRWRPESLDHYLKMGWSMVLRDEAGALTGYFLGQALLFLDGHPQSLWIEHVSFLNLKVRDELCQLAYQLSRDKHFQKVYLPDQSSIGNSVKPLKAETWTPAVFQIKTTKS